MKNIIILGSGRSGTSMFAGIFSKSGYFIGGKPYPPRHSNPKGFFETKEVNRINEEIIAKTIPNRPPIIGNLFFRNRPRNNQRWLSQIPLYTKLKINKNIIDSIIKLTEIEPYCFKDPRFSYTLPVWKPYLKNCLYLCIFRDPATTANSILKECTEVDYLKDLKINRDQALKIWYLMYKHIIEIHSKEGNWHFCHYDQAFDMDVLEILSLKIGTEIDYSFPEKHLNRSSLNFSVPTEIDAIYKKLCKLAGYQYAK